MPLIGGILYAQDDSEITYVVERLGEAAQLGLAGGLDTEFYGVDIGKQSCAGRAKLHFLSVAWPVLPERKSARGIRLTSSAVFTSEALLHPALRNWLASDALKAIHNAPVDLHTLANAGIQVKGAVNTLAMARWAWPERARSEGFTLDYLGRDFLGVGKLSTFDEVFTEQVEEYKLRIRKDTHCECGARPCRKRSSTPGHCRVTTLEETRIPHRVDREIPMEQVVYGHPRFTLAVQYAAQDAVLALNIYELARAKMGGTIIEVPWLD